MRRPSSTHHPSFDRVILYCQRYQECIYLFQPWIQTICTLERQTTLGRDWISITPKKVQGSYNNICLLQPWVMMGFVYDFTTCSERRSFKQWWKMLGLGQTNTARAATADGMLSLGHSTLASEVNANCHRKLQIEQCGKVSVPIILSLYRIPSNNSMPVFSAMNSDPNVLVSIEFCFLLYQRIGALLT